MHKQHDYLGKIMPDYIVTSLASPPSIIQLKVTSPAFSHERRNSFTARVLCTVGRAPDGIGNRNEAKILVSDPVDCRCSKTIDINSRHKEPNTPQIPSGRIYSSRNFYKSFDSRICNLSYETI